MNKNTAASLIIIAFLAALAAVLMSNVPPRTPAPVPSVSCVEDEPCWDCDTMGNRTCGPTVTPSPKVRRS